MWRALLLFTALACGGDGNSSDEKGSSKEDCDSCSDDEFCLVLAEGDFEDWVESCEPTPAACELPAACDCAGELYDLCPDSPSSWACSDTFPPAIVTCGYN